METIGPSASAMTSRPKWSMTASATASTATPAAAMPTTICSAVRRICIVVLDSAGKAVRYRVPPIRAIVRLAAMTNDEPHALAQNIGAVERETGLSKDVLRMWERRYGFPKPARDDNGERQYTVGETAKLRAIKRLMETGVRPGKIISLSLDELNALTDARAPVRREAPAPALERDVIAMLKTHDATALQH